MEDINKTGVYKIVNTLTGEFYIGSTGVSFDTRYKSHLYELKNNRHGNHNLQRIYNEHGEGIFKLEIVEIIEDREEIIKREQFYIDQGTNYNIAQKVEMPPLGPSWNKGLEFSEESKQKMSKSKMGNKINLNKNKQKNRPIIREDGKVYSNVKDAAMDIGASPRTLAKYISHKNPNRRVKGWRFDYIQIQDKDSGIHKCKTGFAVRIKGEYLGYFKSKEEARKRRDQYLLDNPGIKVDNRYKRMPDFTEDKKYTKKKKSEK